MNVIGSTGDESVAIMETPLYGQPDNILTTGKDNVNSLFNASKNVGVTALGIEIGVKYKLFKY